ncbi:hypothetical protein ACFCWG_22280 [Streptomyces sp. NPDC056390]|uniref:hypothetical protein n=1 Tax=Streptomyces sp. NPDC056390 TaxID=3345806 RepID=UPI0035DC332C
MQHTPSKNAHDTLDALLGAAHAQLETAVNDRLMAEGGLPELRDPDLALGRLLAFTHRAVGTAVSTRLARPAQNAADGRSATPGAPFTAASTLANRPPAVRLKHRSQALQLAHRYWPRDLVDTLRSCLRIVEELGEILDEEELSVQVQAAVRQLNGYFSEALCLPDPRRRSAPPEGPEYLTTVEAFLAMPAEQLVYGVHNARQLLDGAPEHFLGVDEVIQDLADDLEEACERARVLSRATAEVEKASNDFIGADLSGANLDGVLLEGVRWDAATCWPQQWETLIRRASLPAADEGGVLVVTAEPHDSVIPAEA